MSGMTGMDNMTDFSPIETINAIIEEIKPLSCFRYYDSRRLPQPNYGDTLFWLVPNPQGRGYWLTRKEFDSEPVRFFKTQYDAIANISRHFDNNGLGIELVFDILDSHELEFLDPTNKYKQFKNHIA